VRLTIRRKLAAAGTVFAIMATAIGAASVAGVGVVRREVQAAVEWSSLLGEQILLERLHHRTVAQALTAVADPGRAAAARAALAADRRALAEVFDDLGDLAEDAELRRQVEAVMSEVRTTLDLADRSAAAAEGDPERAREILSELDLRAAEAAASLTALGEALTSGIRSAGRQAVTGAERARTRVALLTGALLLLVLGLGAWLGRDLRRRIEGLRSVAEDLDRGTLEGEVSAQGGDELDSVRRALERARSNIRGALGADRVDWEELGRRQQELSLMAAVAQNVPVGVMLADREFRITYANPAAIEVMRSVQDQLPCRPEEVVGRCIDDFHRDPAHQRRLLQDASKLPYEAVIRIGGEAARVRASAIQDEAGRPLGTLATWEIVTEEERAREQSERLAAHIARLARGEVPEPIAEDVVPTLRELRDNVNELTRSLGEIAAVAEALADGRLDIEVAVRSGDDRLLECFSRMVANLSTLLADAKAAAQRVARDARSVERTSDDLSQNATQSAAALEEISSTMEELSGQTRQNAENAGRAVQLATEARQYAETGDEQMRSMVAAMGEIDEASKNISKIIKVIDDIAFQTNLLALNAAVEAARAGVHGKGFAVVAEEVRNLAERSAQAAKETTDLIDGSSQRVRQGAVIAEKTAQSLAQIVESISQASDLVSEIAAASSEQAEGIGQVNIGLSQVDQATQRNTASAEEMAASAQTLSAQAHQLQASLANFRLASGHEQEPAEEPGGTAAAAAGGASVAAQPSGGISLEDDDFGRY